jgi:hypothetical protein
MDSNNPDYIYHDPIQPTFGPLPEGQYSFVVLDLPAPPYTSKAGNFVFPVKIGIGPEKVPLYDNPSAGVTTKGNPYDNVAAFLKAIERNPKSGERPNLTKQNLVGARGEVMIKVEIAQKGTLIGKPVNKVHYYVWNKEAAGGNTALVPAAHGQVDPADIPF